MKDAAIRKQWKEIVVTDFVYDEERDREVNGNISLDIGACAYRDAMRTKDPAEKERLFGHAMRWYERSADMGNAQAATNLGYIFLYGRVSAPDYGKAFDWFAKGAELGNEESCYKLGDMYRSGKGCERDSGKAMELYRKAEVIARRTCNPEDPQDQAVLASIDLRLAEQCEHTAGGRAEAYRYYRRAVENFESAVAAGLNWYGKTLDSARAGMLRTESDSREAHG